MAQLSDDDFATLLHTRRELRRFLRFSENAARSAGITPAQHQLLLAVRGTDDPDGPRIRDLAESLYVAHHSAVELIDRSAAAGLVQRHTDRRDQRVVRIRLTEHGEHILNELTPSHIAELARLRTAFAHLSETLPGGADAFEASADDG